MLAAFIVLFHFGGLSWIVGRIAVFAFYSISGFLIFQVLDRIYLDERRGVWRFLGTFYYLRRRWGQPLPLGFVLALLVAWVLVVTVPALDVGSGPPRSAAVFTEYLWLTCVLGALLALTHVRRLKALDTAGGNLCYGIYLNHFLVAALLLHAGTARYVGAPGTLTFGMTVLLGSAGLAFLTDRVLERRSTGCDLASEATTFGRPLRASRAWVACP